jgi:hypothetical protein
VNSTATPPTSPEHRRRSHIFGRSSRGPVRPLTEKDLPQITELYQRSSGNGVESSAVFLRRVFFESPTGDESLRSLAYEDPTGRILGTIGIMPRHMKFRGRDVRAAVGHHFIVDPSRTGTRAGIELARSFLRGPQDLALAAGNESSRRTWEFVGGSVCLLYSLCWTRALRPAQHALTSLHQRGLPPAAAVTFKPLCRAVDATLNVVPHQSFRFQPPTALADTLDAVTLLAFLSAFTNGRSLQPVYNLSWITWLMDVLKDQGDRGTLHNVAVRTLTGRPLGWYMYYLGDSGVAEVLQVGGKEDTIREVLDHLFYHAWQRGAVSATGSMDPQLSGALSENHCTFHRPGDSAMLIHSRDQGIINTIQAGDAFLSRLESEWWISC